MITLDTIYNMDCLEGMKQMEAESVDLTVTSPPYDNLRTYNGYCFDFENIARELYRVTKQGGVVVWVVGDATIDGSETGTSFRQALFFMECGFRLHDTMLFQKQNYIPLTHNRYEQAFEYMFCLSKGRPKTFNPIKVECKNAGKVESYGSERRRKQLIPNPRLHRAVAVTTTAVTTAVVTTAVVNLNDKNHGCKMYDVRGLMYVGSLVFEHELNELNKGTMNKDDYAMLKARQEIVKAFMDKLDKTSMGEASIIPALMDYVQTGNRKLFDDYRMYLETTTIEERIKRAEEANAQVEERAKASADYAEEKIGWHEARKKRAEERLNEIDIELQNIYNVIEEKENAYNEKMHAYRDRMNEIRKAEFDDIDCTEYMTMKNLQDFCAKVIADGGFPNKARKLWAMKDGKLYCVKGLTVLDNGKAVFSIDDDSAIPPKP